MDATENVRRAMVAELREVNPDRAALETEYGKDGVFDTDELTERFSVEGFMAPFVVATRKADGVRGSLMFKSSPRLYFGFSPA